MSETNGDLVESLRSQLADTQLQLQTAAEFGGALLEKNQTLEAECMAIEQRLQAREEEIEHLRNEVAEQKEMNKQLLYQRSQTTNTDISSISEYETKIKILKSVSNVPDCPLPNNRQKYETSKDQIREVTNANNLLQDQLNEKNTMLMKYRGIDKELLQNREETEVLVTEKEILQGEIEKSKEQIVELKREVSNLRVSLKKSEERNDKLELDISELTLQLKKKGNTEQGKYEQILKELEEAEDAIESLEKTLCDVKYEKKQLEKTVADFAIQNQQLHKEREENLQFMEEARASLANYRQREEESEFELSLNAEMDQDRPDNSLLGELEQELESRIVTGDGSAAKPVPPPGAPENCEEFFFLAATAVKIAFAMQAPKTSDGCFRINIKALYKQALEAEVPFHEWYDWIKLQLASKQEALVVSVTSSPNSSINRVKNPRPRRTQPKKSTTTASPKRSNWLSGWF